MKPLGCSSEASMEPLLSALAATSGLAVLMVSTTWMVPEEAVVCGGNRAAGRAFFDVGRQRLSEWGMVGREGGWRGHVARARAGTGAARGLRKGQTAGWHSKAGQHVRPRPPTCCRRRRRVLAATEVRAQVAEASPIMLTSWAQSWEPPRALKSSTVQPARG